MIDGLILINYCKQDGEGCSRQATYISTTCVEEGLCFDPPPQASDWETLKTVKVAIACPTYFLSLFLIEVGTTAEKKFQPSRVAYKLQPRSSSLSVFHEAPTQPCHSRSSTKHLLLLRNFDLPKWLQKPQKRES